MIATVTTKGQVTIPVSSRNKYGLHPNDRMERYHVSEIFSYDKNIGDPDAMPGHPGRP